MSTDDRGQIMGPRISVAVATAVILIGIVLRSFYTESTAFREAAEKTVTNDPSGSLVLLAIAFAVAGCGVVVSWWRQGGGSDVDE